MERERNTRKKLSGAVGWLGIAAFVAVWDLKAPETLSAAFERGVDNKHSRAFVLGAMAVTCAHLVGALPEEYDPFKVALALASRSRLAEGMGFEPMIAVDSNELAPQFPEL